MEEQLVIELLDDNKIIKLNPSEMSIDNPFAVLIINGVKINDVYSFEEQFINFKFRFIEIPSNFLEIIRKKKKIVKIEYPKNKLSENSPINLNEINYIFDYHEVSKDIIAFKNGNDRKIFDEYKLLFMERVLEKINKNNVIICCPPARRKYVGVHGLIKDITKHVYNKQVFMDGSDLFKRIIDIEPAHINPSVRDINIQYNSMELVNKEIIDGSNVILIDDVYTSGSTMQACYQHLLNANAKKILMFSFSYVFGGNKHEYK